MSQQHLILHKEKLQLILQISVCLPENHNDVIQRIGGEDVAATLDFTKDNTLQGISVTGFKMNFKKANGTLTTFNIFQQMMLFSLFQGHFVSRSVFNTHQHTETQENNF